MRRTLLLSFVMSLILAITATAQNQNTTIQRDCPGVPGACGYPAQQNHGPSNPTPQNGNGTLGQIYNFSKCGLGYATASQRIGQRFSPIGVAQPAPFVISGIPTCAVIEQAYLWAEGSGNGAAQTATITNPASVTQNFPMTIVGSGPDKCWGYSGSYTYRADVTPIVSGNGTYNISGLLTSPPTSGNDMDGATLMIIYSDPTANYRGSMLIHDGAVVINGGTTTQTITGINACANSTFAQAFMCVGDIQFNPTSWTLNGTAAPLSWNWWNYVQVNTTVTNGQATSNFNVVSAGDCYNLCVIGLYYRTTTCTTCPVPSSLVINTTTTPASCSNCNGTATVTSVTGGTGPFTYSWAPSGGTGATATGLCAGTYTVTVSNTCMTNTAVVTVTTSGGGVTTTGGQTNVLCNGLCTGSATVTPTSGTSPFTYSWAPSGGTGSTASGLCPGTYTVTVTDANGCTGTRTYTITQPPALTTTGGQTNILCNGVCTGSATVTVSGGTGPYSYVWTPSGGNAATTTGRCAGTYTCTVTDANGCVTTRTFNITQPPALATTGGQTNILCFGQCTGTASVTVTGGTGPYTYSWAPSGGTGPTASALCAGTYTVTATDANGCTVTRTYTITQPLSGVTATQAQTNILCNGQCTGSATVTPSGGTSPYTYSWAPSGGTGPTASALCAGTYTCTITDASGCTTTRTITITQPPALATTGGQTNVLCNGLCTGSATVTPSGGTTPYSYSWAPAGGTGATATALCAGTYTVTVTDANGCTTTRTFNITQPPALATTGGQTNVLCFGQCTGSATVTPSGGSGPYTYSWAPSGGTGGTATGLCAGTYTVTVTDANGCTTTRTYTITQPPTAVSATQAQTNVLCNGQCTGSATVTASGGTGPYTYSWAPSGGTGTSASALCAGTYTCTITDANGCTTTRTFSITQPPALATTGSQTNVLCNGQCTGTASVTVTGGTSPYTYSWAPSGGTGANATGLCAGNYTVTATDANGCTITRTYAITQPPAITATTASTNATCGNANGTATVTASGGTPGYTYLWTPSAQTTQTATGLLPGSYSVLVTDANGCTATFTVNVISANSPTATIPTFTNVTCFGACNGTANGNATGGTTPYTYNWTPSGGTGINATGLCPGTYTLTVTDANSCASTATVTITQPTAVAATVTVTPALCNGACNGSATVTATGGTSPYTYNWAPSGGTGSTATGLCAGTYTCTVTDANSCTFQVTATITQPPALVIVPTQTNALCNGVCNGTATATVSGGTPAYTYNWAPSGGTGATAIGLCAGTYTCTVTDANGCVLTQTYTITQPPAITATTSFVNSTCGLSNGSATVNASGGTPGYTYLWTPSAQTTQTATNLLSGNYSVLVTDANGCTATFTVNVPNAGSPTATIPSFTNVTCFGACNGTANGNATGGTTPYTYNWTPSGGTGINATGLCPGTYTLTVTDANTCTSTATVTITQPTAVAATVAVTPALCNGACNGSATVTATGGTSPYTYSWAPSGGTGSTATGLCAGTYTCTVTDANSCTVQVTATITQPPALVIVPTQTDALCNGACNGSATATVSGGTPAYTYSWAPSGGTGATATGLCAGTYTCTVTDANGCVLTQTYTITQPTAITATTSFVNSTCGNANGTATVTPGGGTPGYSYLWTPSSQTTQTATNLLAGNYSVLVTDANGCTATFTVNVPNAGSPSANITATTDVTCFGACDGTATGNASGGTGPYTYSWLPSGGTGSSATGLCAGTYTFQVTDANGCVDDTIITITEPPVLTATAVSTDALCFNSCDGTASVTASGGTPGYAYNWAPSGGTGASATNLCAGTYTCTVTDANGCTTTVTVTINQPTQLTLAIAGFDATCNGACDGQVVVIPSGGTQQYSFAWNPNTTCNSPSCANVCAGSYTVTVTDANGCVDTASTVVNEPAAITSVMGSATSHCNQPDGSAWVTSGGGTGPITVVWNTNPVQTTDTATGLIPGVYTVTLTDANGCTHTDSVTVANAPGVIGVLAASSNVTCNGVCDGTASVTASSGTAPYTYAWAPGGGTNPSASGLCQGNYTCTITDAAGCTATVTVTITEPPLLTLQAVPSTSICAGQSTLMNCTPGGGSPAYTYNWTPGNIGLQSTTLTPTSTGTYTVTVTDANGCTSTATTTVTVNPVPVPAISSDVQSGCAPLDVNFTDASTVASPGVITSWSWDFGNGTGNTQNPFNPYNTPGSYNVTLTVTTADGCAATITMPNYINVYPNPVAEFAAGPQPTTILNPVICFDDQSIGASNWTWSFGDITNSSSVIQEPCFAYSDTGCFDIVLTVTNSNGCIDTVIHPICILPDYSLFIPNTFTPNGDGKNELFMPVVNGIDLSTFEMWIFDRWGNMIFYTDDLSKGWDGRANYGNEVAQQDTYVYKIKCKDIMDIKHQYLGHVNLIK